MWLRRWRYVLAIAKLGMLVLGRFLMLVQSAHAGGSKPVSFSTLVPHQPQDLIPTHLTPVPLCARWFGGVQPNSGTSHNNLQSVSAVSANYMWAVGYY